MVGESDRPCLDEPIMRIYLAGPISGVSPKACKRLFNEAERRLKQNGHTVVNPVRLDAERGPLPEWSDYMKRDIPLLVKCHGIRLLDGWEASPGAQLEWLIAQKLGIFPVDADGFSIMYYMNCATPKKPESILAEADKLVNGPRQAAYGRPLGDFSRTGKLWGALLKLERDVTPMEVALCMSALKLSREVNKHKRDNLTDAAGYAATAQMVAEDLGLEDYASQKGVV